MSSRNNTIYKSAGKYLGKNSPIRVKENYSPYTNISHTPHMYKESFENAPDQEPDHDETLANNEDKNESMK